MRIQVTFYSYLKDLAGSATHDFEAPDNATVQDLLNQVWGWSPEVARVQRSILVAVGTEYAQPTQQLRAGDTVALFPPVQGG